MGYAEAHVTFRLFSFGIDTMFSSLPESNRVHMSRHISRFHQLHCVVFHLQKDTEFHPDRVDRMNQHDKGKFDSNLIHQYGIHQTLKMLNYDHYYKHGSYNENLDTVTRYNHLVTNQSFRPSFTLMLPIR